MERARGFDTIFDNPNFAGGFFSFWNREGIRLTSTGVGLVNGGQPGAGPAHQQDRKGRRTSSIPGLFLYNAGVDIDITPKLRGFVNLNLLRFADTEPLELLLFQSQYSRRHRSRFRHRRSPIVRRFRRTS